MNRLRRNWARAYIVYLMSWFMPAIISKAMGLEVGYDLVFSPLYAVMVHGVITAYCVWIKKGTKWLTILIRYESLQGLILISLYAKSVYNPVEYAFGFIYGPLVLLFIWHSYHLRRGYINERARLENRSIKIECCRRYIESILLIAQIAMMGSLLHTGIGEYSLLIQSMIMLGTIIYSIFGQILIPLVMFALNMRLISCVVDLMIRAYEKMLNSRKKNNIVNVTID